MDSKQGVGSGVASSTTRAYEDFDPHMEWAKEETNFDTLLVYLPGFQKEKLKIQITSGRKLRIGGERSVGLNKLRRFLKEFPIANDIDTNKISAKFEGGILYVKVPKSLINNNNPPMLLPTPTKGDQLPQQQQKPNPFPITPAPSATSDQQPTKPNPFPITPVPPSATLDQQLQKPLEKQKSNKVEKKSDSFDGSALAKVPSSSTKAESKLASNDGGSGKTMTRLETYKKAIVQGLTVERVVKSPRALVNMVLAVLFIGVLALYAKNMFKSSLRHFEGSDEL